MADNVDPKTKILTEILNWNNEINEQKIFGDVPIISDLLYGITALISGMSALVLAGLNTITELLLTGAFNIIDSILLVPFSALTETLINYLINNKLIAKEIKDLLDGVINYSGHENHILSIILYLLTSASALGSIMEVSNVTSQQKLLDTIRPILPTTEQLIRLLFLRPEYEKQWTDMLHSYGFSDDRIYYLKYASMSPLGEEQIRVMYWRDIITQQGAVEKLRMIGKTDEDIESIMKSWEIIPSAQELFWMVGKEAFEPDQVQRYGLDQEFPDEVSPYLKAQGITDYWQRKNWAAHWNYPSVQQVLECLHRGFIERDDVMEYYRVVEIPRYWRDNLIKISYHPYTRVDVRRMHALGTIDDDGLIKAYKDIGYDEEHAKGLRDFTIKYNKGSKDELSKAEILDFFKIGLITEQDCFLMMEEIGYDRDITDLYIKKVKLSIQKEYIKEVIEVTEYLYINNRINTGEIYSRLSKVMIATEKIENYIAKWDVSKQKTRKLPSKEDLLGFYSDNIISVNEFSDVMSEIGYSKKHINWYLESLSKER